MGPIHADLAFSDAAERRDRRGRHVGVGEDRRRQARGAHGGPPEFIDRTQPQVIAGAGRKARNLKDGRGPVVGGAGDDGPREIGGRGGHEDIARGRGRRSEGDGRACRVDRSGPRGGQARQRRCRRRHRPGAVDPVVADPVHDHAESGVGLQAREVVGVPGRVGDLIPGVGREKQFIGRRPAHGRPGPGDRADPLGHGRNRGGSQNIDGDGGVIHPGQSHIVGDRQLEDEDPGFIGGEGGYGSSRPAQGDGRTLGLGPGVGSDAAVVGAGRTVQSHRLVEHDHLIDSGGGGGTGSRRQDRGMGVDDAGAADAGGAVGARSGWKGPGARLHF